ncbi:MAG: hypothetical protein E7J15_10215, partial [Neisseria sp.]|nr:hypothetical protein [Neisseria sp.]
SACRCNSENSRKISGSIDFADSGLIFKFEGRLKRNMFQTAFLLYKYWILRMVAFIIESCFQCLKGRLKACL